MVKRGSNTAQNGSRSHETPVNIGWRGFVPRRFVVAEFATPEGLLAGTTKLREAGHKNLDTYTPMPIHGLEKALGLGRPKIPLIVLCGAIAGACIAYSMIYFCNVIDFPINVGMWCERFNIIVTSLHRDFLPSKWENYFPTWVDISLFIGTIGLFSTLFLLFLKFVPAVAVTEVKELRHELAHDPSAEPVGETH